MAASESQASRAFAALDPLDARILLEAVQSAAAEVRRVQQLHEEYAQARAKLLAGCFQGLEEGPGLHDLPLPLAWGSPCLEAAERLKNAGFGLVAEEIRDCVASVPGVPPYSADDTAAAAAKSAAREAEAAALARALPLLDGLARRLEEKAAGRSGQEPAAVDEGGGEGDGGGRGGESAQGKNKSTNRRRGRPTKGETQQRAEFAKLLIAKGLTWPEVFQKYAKRFPKDKEASADALRCTYQRAYPAGKSDAKRRKPA